MSANWLQQAQLTTSGLPILLRGEVERIVVPDVNLRPDDPSPALSSGRLHLTSHRLIWIDQPSTSAFSIPLSSVLDASPFKKKSLTNLFHSPRIRLLLDRGSGSSIGVILVLRRRDELSESFLGKLIEVLRQRTWEVEEKDNGEGTSSSRGWTGPVVGVAGILRKEQEAWESTDKSLQEAFQDLNALMSKAKDMVLLAEKMRQKLLSGSSNQVNTSTEEDVSSKQEMQDWLLSVGIASPVTKESAGAMYHQQLSRQLADFVKVPLERNGGMIALIDIYCLFNRARGTELISPDDLLQACALWEKFDVPVLLREFDSGVKVIQSKNHSDEEVFSRISALVVKPEAIRKGISPSDAAITLGIAPALAKEQLLAAEKRGLLCRDVSPDGFRFHANLLQEIDPRDIYRVNNHGVYGLWISTAS